MTRERFLYTPFFCEENVWQLCQHPELSHLEKQVVFISNHNRSCPFWSQRASTDDTIPVTWDYHVILLCKPGSSANWQVWDLDSTLSMPVAVEQYMNETFRHIRRVEVPFHPLFKVLDAQDYVRTFSSDRSHMLDTNGCWLEPPPTWPEINQNSQANLMNFIDMNQASEGTVMSIVDFSDAFA